MSRISIKSWEREHSKTGEFGFSETRWPVYRKYELCGLEGHRYLWASASRFEDEVRSVDPLTAEHASLFLRFARWFDEKRMQRSSDPWHDGTATLDTPRNGQAALDWAHEYGVLGLGRNPNESFAVGSSIFSSSAEISALRVGAPNRAHSGTRAYSKSRKGGQHEAVEDFVLEAHEANVVLKLYEAATAPTVNISSISRFMSKRDDPHYLPAKYSTVARTEREWYSQDPEEARLWALAVVEEAVNRKVENDVYPILLGNSGSYEPAWGFKSLLGAMWLQMRGFMLATDNICPECRSAFVKTRRDKTYCGEKCAARARARRNYHEGTGKSSKRVREQERRRAGG